MAIRVGVIGVGYLGQHHARIYSELKEVELVALVDKGGADALAERYKCKAYSDYREILNEVDALSIVTPTTSHYRIALDCLKAGKDILIEKPITVDIREAEELIVESEKRDCILQVGHLERYNPALVAASGMIKDPRFIEAERLSPFLERATDVDVTFDLMIHDADIVLSLVPSRIKKIRAVGAQVLTEKIDVAKAWIEFENGCVVLFTASRLAPEKKRRLKIFQEDSYLSIDYQMCEIKHKFKTAKGLSANSIKPDSREPLREELVDFLHCVKERRRPRVSAVEAKNALKLVLEITELIRRRNEEVD